ncbi:hypothetical protein Cni_G03050 [Canna indica]|uniref:FLZ-type domain-containing protein n=1 Tax=Canna indica TaxID=4628 RepID=A0AAQ3JRU4_9LILI|nr:hypothetical protein Cni_G03050 [Canna indica]
MLLRKRPRHLMRRTTSMTGFAADAEAAPRPSDDPVGADSRNRQVHRLKQQRNQRRAAEVDVAAAQWRVRGRPADADWLEADQYAVGVEAAGAGGGGVRRRNSGDFSVAETAPFLMACGLCKRRLGPGRDTFMYRGDTAFCSLECRQQHINQVELKEKCSLTSMKDTSQAPTTVPDKSDNGETASAA